MSEPEQEQVPAWLRAEYRLFSLTILVLFFFTVGYVGERSHMAREVYGGDSYPNLDHAQGVDTVIVGVTPGAARYDKKGGWDMMWNRKNGHIFLLCTSKERARRVVEKCIEAWEKEGSSREELR